MNASINFPININFRNLVATPAIQQKAEILAKKLGQYFHKILQCNVIVESHHHHYRGNIYHVSIHLMVPNTELVINRNPADNHAHEDVYVALRDAFSAMKRKLQTYGHKLKHNGKARHSLDETLPESDERAFLNPARHQISKHHEK